MIDSSVSTTLARIRRQMRSGSRAGFNLLDGAIDADDTTISLAITPDAGLRAGSEICIDVELMYVRSVSTNSVVVIRGWEGSTAVAHDSGTLVEVNPRFSSYDILNAMRAEIGSWGPALYRVDTQTFAVDGTTELIELTTAGWANCYGIGTVMLEPTESVAYGRPVPISPLHRVLRTEANKLTSAPSGLAIRLIESYRIGTLVVEAGLPFESFDIGDDLVTDVGLVETQLDVVEMGVKARLLVDAENNRGQRAAQGESREAAETPPGSLVSTNQMATLLYRNRKEEEINKLQARHPLRWV